MERAKSTTAILCLQILLIIAQLVEGQYRVPPITTTVFPYTVEQPMPDAYGVKEIAVSNGKEFTIQFHLDQTPTEDDYDFFLSECSANGIPFMDDKGCAIRSRSIAPVSMTRDMYVIRKDDTRLTQTNYKNDKFAFVYLAANGGGRGGGSVQIVCSIKYVACQGMMCQRQPGCTNYMSSNTIPSVQAVSSTVSVRIEGDDVGNEDDGSGNPNPTYWPQRVSSTHSSNARDLDTAGIAWWHIALICVVALLLFIVVIALLVVMCCRKSEPVAKSPSRPARNATQRPDSRIYEEVYEQRHYYTPSENASRATYAPTNVSESRVALAAYNNNRSNWHA